MWPVSSGPRQRQGGTWFTVWVWGFIRPWQKLKVSNLHGLCNLGKWCTLNSCWLFAMGRAFAARECCENSEEHLVIKQSPSPKPVEPKTPKPHPQALTRQDRYRTPSEHVSPLIEPFETLEFQKMRNPNKTLNPCPPPPEADPMFCSLEELNHLKGAPERRNSFESCFRTAIQKVGSGLSPSFCAIFWGFKRVFRVYKG